MSNQFKKFKNKSKSKKNINSQEEYFQPNVEQLFYPEVMSNFAQLDREITPQINALEEELQISFNFDSNKFYFIISYFDHNHELKKVNKRQKKTPLFSKMEVNRKTGEVYVYSDKKEEGDLSEKILSLILFSLIHRTPQSWINKSINQHAISNVLRQNFSSILKKISLEDSTSKKIKLDHVYYYGSSFQNASISTKKDNHKLIKVSTNDWKIIKDYVKTDENPTGYFFDVNYLSSDPQMNQTYHDLAYDLNFGEVNSFFFSNFNGIAHNVIFHFSDQTTLDLATLMIHPYSAFCLELILSLFRGDTKVDQKIDKFLFSLTSHIPHRFKYKFTALFKNILQQQIPFSYIPIGPNPLHLRDYNHHTNNKTELNEILTLPVLDLGFSKEESLVWELKTVQQILNQHGKVESLNPKDPPLQYAIIPSSKSRTSNSIESLEFIELHPGVYYDPRSQKIGHSYLMEQYNFWIRNQQCNKKYFNRNTDENSNSTPNKAFYFLLKDNLTAEDITWLMQSFEEKFNSKIIHQVEEFPLHRVQVYLDFSSSNPDQMKISLQMGEENVISLTKTNEEMNLIPRIECLNTFLNAKYTVITRFLQEGIGSFFYQENRDIVVTKAGIIRQNSLKLLRHSGLAKLLFLTCYEAIRDNPSLNSALLNQLKLDFKRAALKLLIFKKSDMEKFNAIEIHGEDQKSQIKSKNDLVKDLFKKNYGTKMDSVFNELIKFFLPTEHDFIFLKTNLGQLYSVRNRPITILIYDQIYNFLKTTLDHKIFEKQKTKNNGPQYNFSSFYNESSPYYFYERYDESSLKEFFPEYDSSYLQELAKKKLLPSPTLKFEAPNIFQQMLSIPSEDLAAQIRFDSKTIRDLSSQQFDAMIALSSAQDETTSNSKSIDWFDLHPEIFFDGEKITNINEITTHGNHCLEYQGQLYRIPKQSLPILKWLNYFWEKVQGQRNSKYQNRLEGQIIYMPKSLALDLLAMKKAGIKISGGNRWNKLEQEFNKIQELRSFDQLNEQLFSQDFNVPLKPFQKEGTAWMYQLYLLQMGGVLADDMGLGKTIQSIGLMELLYQQNKLDHNLIIVPTSLTYNWMQEFEKFAPHIPKFNYVSANKNEYEEFLKNHSQTVTIITYGLFSRNAKYLQELTINFNLVIFDEAQNLKNITTSRTKAARLFQAKVKFCLTGTPMENHYGELFSLVDLVVPGVLGNYVDFMKKLSFKASQSQDLNNIQQEIDFLKLKISPLILRREKQKILHELPDKTETELHFDFDKQQEKIYKDVATAWNQKILEAVEEKGAAKSKLEVLTAILRLRQVCSMPSSLPNIKYNLTPPKMLALTEQLEELNESGHKSLVFTNFTSTLFEIERILKEKGIPVYTIHGGTNKKSRENFIHKFIHEPAGAVMLMTLKTGGVGLNLTCANYVFHIEPWWNPAVENQATDRAHRMGQKNKVNVYRYIMNNSIEEKMITLKDRKKMAIDSLFCEDANSPVLGKSSVSYEDFLNLV